MIVIIIIMYNNYVMFLFQLRSVDSNILVGLCIQNTLITQYYTCGQTKAWKIYTGRTIEQLLYLITTRLIITYLGIRLMLPDKVDILNGRYM